MRCLIRGYLTAKETVVAEGYASEIDWQDNLCLSRITETDFLREAAWVVLSSGMRESVIRTKFPGVSAAFYSWRNARCIAENSGQCVVQALAVFGHRLKMAAIVRITERVCTQGFDRIKTWVGRDGTEYIRTLPFMGPATSYHLAKNLGLDVVKPDRHLLRVAAVAGYDSPSNLCEDISAHVGDRISVVDLVIWRFATLCPDYTDCFAR